MSNLTDFENGGIRIKLNFSDPLLVSQGRDADRIYIKLLKSYFLQPDPMKSKGWTRSLADVGTVYREDDLYLIVEHDMPP